MYLLVHLSFKTVRTEQNTAIFVDECPESYCRTPGVAVGMGVHKNFYLAYNSWTTIIELSYFTYVFLVTRPFPGCQYFWPNDLDVWPTFIKL